MPELPDIVVLARSMDEALQGKTIAAVTVNQPKCLNLSSETFEQYVVGRRLESFWQRGKWVLAALDDGATLALNLGMGGEMCLHGPDEVPDPGRERVVLTFTDDDQLWIHHWWFGSVHYVPPGELDAHPQVGELGIEPLDATFTSERLAEMLDDRRGRIKSYLLDQHFIAGIGNVYVQDILWESCLHPERKASSLNAPDIEQLHAAIQHVLQGGIEAGGGPGEKDVYGNSGQYMDVIQIGYRSDEPCPTCGSPISTIRVGQTTSYICPNCQSL